MLPKPLACLLGIFAAAFTKKVPDAEIVLSTGDLRFRVSSQAFHVYRPDIHPLAVRFNRGYSRNARRAERDDPGRVPGMSGIGASGFGRVCTPVP